MLPSELYRTSVKQLCTQYRAAAGADPNEDFYRYLEENFQQTKNRLVGSTYSDDNERLANRNALFVFAVGVFAFGNIEAAKDILHNIPSSGHVQRLALSLKAMLPVPKEIEPTRDIEKMSDWLDSNLSKLTWKESSGVYEYREQQ